MLKRKQVNLIIKDRVLRYIVSTEPTIAGVIDYGEKFLEPNTIEDGKIVNPKKLMRVLAKLIKDKRWRHKSLAFCVPDAFVTIREIVVPKQLEKEEIKSYIELEIEDSIRLPFTDPVFDFDIVGEENDQLKVLLFAYPKEQLNEYLEVFDKVGLKAKVADLASLSLYRLYFSLDLANREQHLLSIQWNKDATVLTAFRVNKPVFTRYLKSPLSAENWSWNSTEDDLDWAGEQVDLDQSIEEQLVTIDRFMNFYQYSIMDGEATFNKVLLSGDMPNLESIETLLNERYDMKVEGNTTWESRLNYPAKYVDALGLSVKHR